MSGPKIRSVNALKSTSTPQMFSLRVLPYPWYKCTYLQWCIPGRTIIPGMCTWRHFCSQGLQSDGLMPAKLKSVKCSLIPAPKQRKYIEMHVPSWSVVDHGVELKPIQPLRKVPTTIPSAVSDPNLSIINPQCHWEHYPKVCTARQAWHFLLASGNRGTERSREAVTDANCAGLNRGAALYISVTKR